MEEKILPLQIKNLSMTYYSFFFKKRKEAIKGLNLEIYPSEIFGYLGPNGAGKTTTIKIIVGLIRQTRGEVFIYGMASKRPESRYKLGYMPENPNFYDYLTGREVLDLCGSLFSIPRRLRRRLCEELLEKFDLIDAADIYVREYSKGMRQRLGLAQSLVHNPDILILDEPMSGLDPMGRAVIKNAILDLRNQGKTVFFSSHILPDVEAICTRVGLLVNGELREVGSIKDLLETQVKYYEILCENITPEELIKHRPDLNIHKDFGRVVVKCKSQEETNSVIQIILANRGSICAVTPIHESLEEFFVRKATVK